MPVYCICTRFALSDIYVRITRCPKQRFTANRHRRRIHKSSPRAQLYVSRILAGLCAYAIVTVLRISYPEDFQYNANTHIHTHTYTHSHASTHEHARYENNMIANESTQLTPAAIPLSALENCTSVGAHVQRTIEQGSSSIIIILPVVYVLLI